MKSPLVIGITDCGRWSNYANWVTHGGQSVETINLSWKNRNLARVEECDGIMLSGGEDLHPRFYGMPERITELDPREVNERRDDFELDLIGLALRKGLPILGICRGLQVVNVFLGGTLILDIPSTGKSDHSKLDGVDRVHEVEVAANTGLARIVGMSRGIVNSSHHQSADKIGRGLKISAVAQDGVVEGLEWEDSDGKSFLQLVQWHPERMQDAESPFRKNLLHEFLYQASKDKLKCTRLPS